MTINLFAMNKSASFVSVSVLLLLVIAASVMACTKSKEPTPCVNEEVKFEGHVIVVGAGASGLAAAKRLEEEGVSFQILEASDRLCGRVQKNEGFADFPIDLGAEWIHEDKAILNYLLHGEGGEPDAETILYQPMDVDYAVGSMVYPISEQDMEAYYEDYILEYKFKSTTWYDFLYENFAQGVEDRVALNARVAEIDYSGDQVKLTTDEGVEYFADKVISTVSVGVLRSNGIVFEPPMPEEKWEALQDVEFLPGFKLFLKFSEQFYPDVISVETSSGEKTFYDVAYGKESENHILGLLSTGSSAKAYYELESADAIVDAALQELDGFYNGAASQAYLGTYLYQDWGQHHWTQGTWTSDLDAGPEALGAPLDDKVFFAGETLNPVDEIDGFMIIRGSVQSAILSGYAAVDRMLD